jgi:hypothetical protein
MSILSIMRATALSTAALAFIGSAEAASFFFEGDMVRGRPQEGATGPTCVLSSQFKPLEHVVWRVRVLKADGQPADDKALKSLVVTMSDGQTFTLAYGKHPRNPPQTDAFWATSWAIPANFPTGSLTFKVVATDLDGAAQEWAPFNVESSRLTVIPGAVTFTK